jgi:hypothetical protein
MAAAQGASGGQAEMKFFLFPAALLALLQLFAAATAMGLGFDPKPVWPLLVPMVLCILAWWFTRPKTEPE